MENNNNNNNNNEENFFSNQLDCKYCKQFLEKPFFCTNCNNNFCYDCIKNKKICFFCKNQTKFEKNIIIERLLINVKPICKYCKKEFKNKKEIVEHKKSHNLIICKFCDFFETDNKNEFWNHLNEEHKNEIIINFGLL